MNAPQDSLPITRRRFIGTSLAAAALLPTFKVSGAEPHSLLAPKAPMLPPKAKSIILIVTQGGMSQMDTFDPKPELDKHDGKKLTPEILPGIGEVKTFFGGKDGSPLMRSPYKFAKHGQCGMELSEVLPNLAKVSDDICLVRSCHTDQFNHAPAQIFFNTGFSQPGRPSLGAWTLYGLGAVTSELPAFVVMSTGAGISGGAANWSSGFLPTLYTGVRFRNQGDPILNVSSPAGIDADLQKETLDLVGSLNKDRLATEGDPEIATRIASYEMAYRLQSSAPELMDLKSETKETLELYGCEPDKPSFARACLLARRMVERGVRFINIYHEGWDAHSDVAGNVKNNCAATEKASAALVQDLKRLGMLDSTLVIWGGEFGRTPMVETNTALGRSLGRDHHPQAYSMWLAGGGIKAGMTHGKTDDLGFHVAENPVHVHDLQATILHALGLDHEKLTYRYAGRDFRLTDVHGKVVKEILT